MPWSLSHCHLFSFLLAIPNLFIPLYKLKNSFCLILDILADFTFRTFSFTTTCAIVLLNKTFPKTGFVFLFDRFKVKLSLVQTYNQFYFIFTWWAKLSKFCLLRFKLSRVLFKSFCFALAFFLQAWLSVLLAYLVSLISMGTNICHVHDCSIFE